MEGDVGCTWYDDVEAGAATGVISPGVSRSMSADDSPSEGTRFDLLVVVFDLLDLEKIPNFLLNEPTSPPGSSVMFLYVYETIYPGRTTIQTLYKKRVVGSRESVRMTNRLGTDSFSGAMALTAV